MDRQHNIINHPSPQTTPQLEHAAAASTAFHHPNGFPPSPTATRGPSSDIEMVSFNGTSYISLRDLLPSPIAFPRPPSYESAWLEIPIKNPLVKHAAIAYLQPMSSAPTVAEGKGIVGAIMDRCVYGICRGVEDEDEGACCLRWLSDAVTRTAMRARIGRDGRHDNDHDDEDDEEEEENEIAS